MGFLDNLLNSFGGNSSIKKLKYEDAANNLNKDKNIILIDVREKYEFQSGHIKGAKNIPLSVVDKTIETIAKDKNSTLYVYCQSGARSARACQVLSTKGYTNVYNLGGIMGWPYGIVR
ncbi:rhodanese-like domain-containing protein [Lachnoclostridium phytofermentans]|uniref:Rhodanese domain protein n=1 Tax=Lachnoclostridium phytofermentans (strain ATCC 700394 / DSM 18823 / ISDg) TaxID=357809 RepID=A9KT27_LACP7|nr:rhodanese-like domain-containing protein [Lachnoclostridium phytofermentans]ABX42238.1 Rhodanese domain protein [Lachnoclostridium phytofermentans ISDg]